MKSTYLYATIVVLTIALGYLTQENALLNARHELGRSPYFTGDLEILNFPIEGYAYRGEYDRKKKKLLVYTPSAFLSVLRTPVIGTSCPVLEQKVRTGYLNAVELIAHTACQEAKTLLAPYEA